MSPAPPTVFDTPTLGYAVRPGELYDQRSSKFLGVQLYPHGKAKMEEVTTNIRNTTLSVSLSTTHEDKTTLLDINGKLSLDLLSGLVKASGSASYLNDQTANTNEYAYALALKMRLNEKRILFAENELGRKVLPVAQEDYIDTRLATHFVSAVTYGGNYIVNLVARKSEVSREQNIQGKLELEFNKLKGAIDLDGEADANVKNNFEHLNDKFDLTIHGDVALDKVPINPQDVLDTFPQAAFFISEGGGVPISVTLQPIPPKLYKEGLVYNLDELIVNDLRRAFSILDDISSRFKVLQDGVKGVREYVPELAQTTRAVAATFTETYNTLLYALGKFLQDYQYGKKPDAGTVFSSVVVSRPDQQKGDGDTERYPYIIGDTAPKAACTLDDASPPDQQQGGDDTVQHPDITSKWLYSEAVKLYKKHLNPDLPKDDKVSKQYRPSLVALENELLRFQYFASDVQKVRQSLLQPPDAAGANPFYLSSIGGVSKAIGIQNKTPLFVMTPLTADNVNPNLAVVRYLALLRKYPDYLDDTTNPAHMLYAEDLGTLDLELGPPNKQIFSTLERPSFFVGTVDSDGELTWAEQTCGPDQAPHRAVSVKRRLQDNAFKQQRPQQANPEGFEYIPPNIGL